MKSLARSILEYSSKELVDLSKSDTPNRYNRRGSIGRSMVVSADIDYSTGNAIIKFNTHDHIQTIEMEDFVGLVSDEILNKYKDGVPRQDIVRIVKVAVRLLLEEGDILVDCDCDDYKYRFNWIAKQYGYALTDRIKGHNYAPRQTNPNLKGGLCKHLIRVLSRMSDWTDTASRLLINDLLSYDKFLDLLIKNSDDDQEVSDIDDKILNDTDKNLTGSDEPDDNPDDTEDTEVSNDEVDDNDSSNDDSHKDSTEFTSVFDKPKTSKKGR